MQSSGDEKRTQISYTISEGDTFWGLEERLGINHGDLQKLNPGLDPHNLQIGTNIVTSIKESKKRLDINLNEIKYTVKADNTYIDNNNHKLEPLKVQFIGNNFFEFNRPMAEFHQGVKPGKSVMKRFEEWLNSPGLSKDIAITKFGGRILYGVVDEVVVFTTNWELVQVLVGLDSGINLNGSPVTASERLDKGFGGFVTLAGTLFGLQKNFIDFASSYSKYANKKYWSKSVDRVKKEFLRIQTNKNVIQNKSANTVFGRAEAIINYSDRSYKSYQHTVEQK